MLISRSEPAPNFARMRVAGQLALLDWEALRLQPQETTELLRGLDPAFPLGQAAQLHQQCAGWTAGLILLHENGHSATPTQAVFDARSAQQMFDYFEAEVFARRQPAVQDMLMLTALFTSFSSARAERISGTARATAWLDDLVSSHPV